MQLEQLGHLPEATLSKYEELAAGIFAKYDPEDTAGEKVDCYSCGVPVPDRLV